jgi:tRNA modification GTPase
VQNRLSGVLEAARQGSLLREGVQIVLVGRPNVGKSSLLNRLAGEELAIVTDIPGTTRDVIRTTISLNGIPAHVLDTAGLRDAADPVEQAGISRTWAAVEQADLILVLMDARVGEESAETDILSRLPGTLPRLKVMNKADLVLPDVLGQGDALRVSARTGLGMAGLQQALLDALGAGHAEEGLFLARVRHLDALRRAKRELELGAGAADRPELLAEHLRLAQNALGEITGEISADDLLGEIFSRFCIGK